jgi:hypothetical protein
MITVNVDLPEEIYDWLFKAHQRAIRLLPPECPSFTLEVYLGILISKGLYHEMEDHNERIRYRTRKIENPFRKIEKKVSY